MVLRGEEDLTVKWFADAQRSLRGKGILIARSDEAILSRSEPRATNPRSSRVGPAVSVQRRSFRSCRKRRHRDRFESGRRRSSLRRAESESPVRLVLDPVLGNAQARELRDDRLQKARRRLLGLVRL